MTDEHIWGQWIKDHIQPATNKHYFLHVSMPHPGEEIPGEPRIRAGDSTGAKVSVVCASCNSGWMSHLQQTAKPYLIPLFEGTWGKLSGEAQVAVSKWVTMATMTAEYLPREPLAVTVPQVDREQFMNGSIPLGWRIWIGRLQMARSSNQWVRGTFPILDAENVPDIFTSDHNRPNQQTAAFQIGKLFVFAFNSAFPTIPAGWDWRTAPIARSRLRQIWPIERDPLPGAPLRNISANDSKIIARAFIAYSDDLAKRVGYGVAGERWRRPADNHN